MKKDPIDKLFEDKLRDYSEVPDDKVWKAIEASLNQKKKSRKILPVWWKWGGAAAILALLIYLISPGETSPETNQPVTRTEEGQPPIRKESPSKEEDKVFPLEQLPAVAGTEREDEISTPKETHNKEQSGSQPAQAGNPPSARPEQVRQESPDQSALAERGIEETPKNNGRNNMNIAGEQNIARESVNQVSGADRETPEKQVAGIAGEPKAVSPLRPDTAPEDATKAEPSDEAGKKSLFDEIKEKEEAGEAVTENSGSHWSVGPRVAPVYFNSFGKGSPIHSSFVANPKSGNISFSYGLSLSYAVSPRLSIRSGINKVDYGYDTNDISFSPSLAATSGEQINNINYSLTSRNLVVRSSSQEKVAQQALAADVSAEFSSRNGRMVQQFGYVEIPLELSFAVVESKLGLHVVGGLSSLFLVDNSVNLESDGSSMEMGEANNLNSLNFSTNLGFGLDYKLTPHMLISLEPVFKYQLNTFSDTSGSFNPYSVGVYSGLNFKF